MVCSLCACGTKNAGDGKETGKIKIVTTIFPEYDWVMGILGDHADKAEVTMLLDNGVDMHSYQPTVDDILKISDCDLFIYVGGESDEWVDDALREAVNPDLVALNVNLHSAGRVFDIRENGFSHGAECRHAACDRDFLLLFRFRFEVLPDICGHLHIVEASSEGQNACGSEILNFCRALRENILGLLLGSILNVFFAHSQISFP